MQVKTTIKDGALELPLLYNNNTDILGLGEKAKHKLVTAATATGTNLSLNVTENSMFVVTYIDGDDGYTYAYEIDSITENDGKNTTTLKNLAGGSDISFSEVGKTKDVADFTLTLQAANKDLKTASINVTSGSRGTLSFNRVVTKEGLSFRLPVSNATLAADGNINLSAVSPHTWDMNITEEDKDDTILGGGSVVVTFGINVDDGLEPTTLTGGLTSATMYETEDSSRQYVGWLSTDLATKFFWDKPSSSLKSLEVTYAGEQSSADVYVSEAAVSFTGSSTIKVVKDTEIDSVKDKNLLVVGGSCINTVAAKLLGSDTPLCGSAFSAKTTVGAGQYLIQVIASPYNAQKVAMLVAGYEAADTTAAAAKVNEGTTSTDVGTKVVGPVAA